MTVVVVVCTHFVSSEILEQEDMQGIEIEGDARGIEIEGDATTPDVQNIPISQEEMKDLMQKMTEKPSKRVKNTVPRENVGPAKSLKDRTPLQQSLQNVKNWLWEEKKRKSRGLLQQPYTSWYQTTFTKVIFSTLVILGMFTQLVSWLAKRSLDYEKKYKAQQLKKAERIRNSSSSYSQGGNKVWRVGKRRSTKIPKIPLRIIKYYRVYASLAFLKTPPQYYK